MGRRKKTVNEAEAQLHYAAPSGHVVLLDQIHVYYEHANVYKLLFLFLHRVQSIKSIKFEHLQKE